MRKIDWENPLSEDDILWLRSSGIPGIEERIGNHQAEFGESTPEDETTDNSTMSALDPNAKARGERVSSDGAPVDTTPDPGSVQAGDASDDEDEGDDYDSWKVAELKEAVTRRNQLAADNEDVTSVHIDGTGKDGAITKADVVKALRIWDDENPGVAAQG